MQLGTALHLAILEPELFAERVRPKPRQDRRTTAGKKADAAWEAENAGKIGISPEEYDVARQAAAMVRRKHGPAAALREGRAELSMWWEAEGVLLKSRPDFLDLERGLCVDVKSTSRGLDDASIQRLLHDHYAAMQAAMACSGVLAITGTNLAYAMHLLVVRLAPPIDMRLVEIGLDWLAFGETQLARALSTYRECAASQQWPGWADRGVTTVPMPKWLASRAEEEHQRLVQEAIAS